MGSKSQNIAAAKRAARKYGINEGIFLKMIQQESGFNNKARSGAGAQGIAQFMPATAKGYGVNLHDNRVTDDLEGAAKYLRANLKRTGGNYKQALSIYNSGRPDGYKNISETANYVKTILGGKNPVDNGPSRSNPGGSPSVGGGAPDKALLAQYLLTGSHDTSLLAQAMQGGGGAEGAPNAPSRASGGNARRSSSDLKELFYDPQGGWKNGQKIGAIGGHSDHVHVAVPRNQVKGVGKLAQKMGLHVGENDIFAGKNPTGGHAPNSNHYKGLALDISGNPKAMARFARKIRRIYGTG